MPNASATRLKKANIAVIYTASAIWGSLHPWSRRNWTSRGCAVRRLGHFGDVFEEHSVGVVQSGLFEVARSQRLDCLFFVLPEPAGSKHANPVNRGSD